MSFRGNTSQKVQNRNDIHCGIESNTHIVTRPVVKKHNCFSEAGRHRGLLQFTHSSKVCRVEDRLQSGDDPKDSELFFLMTT